MAPTDRQRDHIRAYVEQQAGEDVVHLERVASEQVGPNRHDIWDVTARTAAGGWSPT